MPSTTKTYSIGEHDKAGHALIARVKQYATKRGSSMSWIVLQALKKYENDIINPSERIINEPSQ